MGLGAMLLVQLPRAMQWRPRLSPRPSAEVIAERRRIARDLHDNLGAQLVCALVLLESSKLREPALHAALEKCLLDLRLIVDSMDSADAPLADRLAQLRYRICPVLAQRGIRMLWEVEAPQSADFPHPDSTAHLVAIVQEALSNALQHAQGTEVEVRAMNLQDIGAWCMEIRDNGPGMEPPPGQKSTAATGKGLIGMAHRATQAGGDLQVLQGEHGGTCIRVVVPWARAT
ncbi:sensor histidine kinase [Acidovorax facilis]|uniref:sensor histidine kinase n=1 Tax=Acidovorax facilis TaxID=12917 RepID=UPI003CF9F8FA